MKQPKPKKNINLKPIESFVGVVLLAALAFKGAQGYAQGPEAVKTGFAVILVALLVKLSLER